MKDYKDKKCVKCRCLYNPLSGNQKYCFKCLTFTCKCCKMSYKTRPNEMNITKFCSRSCQNKTIGVGLDRKKQMTNSVRYKISKTKTGKSVWGGKRNIPWLIGSKNPNWKGGISKEDRLQRVKFRNILQKDILERDNYTCQMCQKRGVDLQVDHILPWSEYVLERFNMNNCRTLCKECHYFITFGKIMKNKNIPWGKNLGRRVNL